MAMLLDAASLEHAIDNASLTAAEIESLKAVLDAKLPNDIEQDGEENALLFGDELVATGEDHTALVTEEGDLYTWGSGEYGRLGHGDETSTNVPKLVQSGLKGVVIQVSAGYAHTACVTRNGALFTWGSGIRGKLGHGNDEKISAPALVQGALISKKVLAVSAGYAYTACVTSDGDLYTWGDGKYGILGHGDDNIRYLPTRNTFFGTLKIVQVMARTRHTACVTGNGALYTWGKPGVFDRWITHCNLGSRPRQVWQAWSW